MGTEQKNAVRVVVSFLLTAVAEAVIQAIVFKLIG
jgi:hypothetical protein